MTPLLTLVGFLLCSVLVSSEITPQADFNMQAMSGKWYLIGFATNAEWFTNRRAGMKMGTAMFTPTADGDVDVSYASLRSDGSCWRMNNAAKKTDVSGKFSYISDSWGSEYDMCVVEVKYDEYALTHTARTSGGGGDVVTKLYGRGVDLSTDLQEKFKQFSVSTGILPQNVVFLPKNAECPDA